MRPRPSTAFAMISAILLTAGAATAQTAAKPTLSAQASAEFGLHIVGPDGRPVYGFLTDKDIGGDGQDPLESCNTPCREDWSLVQADGDIRVGDFLSSDLVGRRTVDGGEVLTYNDHVLFQFRRDTVTEPPQGQGIYSYGGFWVLLAPSGYPVKTSVMEEAQPSAEDQN